MIDMRKICIERFESRSAGGWRFPSRLAVAGWKRGGAWSVLLLATSLLASAAAPTQPPLELSDGRIFHDWSVMRETDDSITIRYPKGAAKIMKLLLPPEVLANYPVVEPPAPPPPPPAEPPPEPPGLDKSVRGERSISDRDALRDTEVRWTCRIAVKETAGAIIRTSKNRAGEFKTDFSFPLGEEDVAPLEEALAKAQKWAAVVAEKNPPGFDKSMGRVRGHEWTFSWDKDRVVVRTGMSEAPRLEQQDLEKIQLLLAALPHMEKERRDEARAGEDFAATLK